MNPALLNLMAASIAPLILTPIAYANNGNIGAGQAGDIVLAWLPYGGTASGFTQLATLTTAYGGKLYYKVSASAESVTSAFEAFMLRLRPNRAVATITAGAVVDAQSASSVPAVGNGGVNVVLSAGQGNSGAPNLVFTGLPSLMPEPYGSTMLGQCAINTSPGQSVAFTTTGGSFYSGGYAGAVQVNFKE